MKIRELLNSHKIIDTAINSKLEQLAELKCLATKVSPTNAESRGNGGVNDRVGRTVARIIDLENKINDYIDRLVSAKEAIAVVVSQTDNEVYTVLLEQRYILHETWETIAEKMGYSLRHTTRLHKEALEYLERLYPDELPAELINFDLKGIEVSRE
ncbi:MAG: hypothetical protein ACI4J7_09250 [Ruminiclostridium sp.]